eukprot:scaffold1807_cov140-Cylindrotheca_fusiformis.AAC.16
MEKLRPRQQSLYDQWQTHALLILKIRCGHVVKIRLYSNNHCRQAISVPLKSNESNTEDDLIWLAKKVDESSY